MDSQPGSISMDSRAAVVTSGVVMTLELAVVPVADAEISKRFYASLGWRLDIDFQSDDYRVIQFTPPGSEGSVMFGRNITAAAPGTSRGLHLVVPDVDTAQADLQRRGIETSEPFHDVGGVFHHSDGRGVVAGVNPGRKSYASYFTFLDPDGNEWTIQEVSARLPGRPGDPSFTEQLSKAVWGSN